MGQPYARFTRRFAFMLDTSLQLIHFPAIRRAIGFESNKSLHRACIAFDIPVVVLNRKVKALRQSDYSLLLQRATGNAEAE
jgi:hypothetical protein